ncbi:MAG: DUF4145 domain-containing protein [Nanoarchaeota archaeon]
MSSKLIKPYNSDGGEHENLYEISTEESLECPFCFIQIEIQILRGIFWPAKDLQLFLKCKKCKNSFIGYAKQDGSIFRIVRLSKGNNRSKEFPFEIKEISPMFTKIYGESEFAEQENLSEICGVGYRKSLEFLIKDYLIKKYPEKEEEIKRNLLGKCINELIENPKIKEIAQRASWLGNDETHYHRKWEGKDLQDLKKLIEITVHFISMDFQTDRYMEEMI